MTTDNLNDYEFVLVQWPDSQILMEYPWFEKEAVLDADSKYGSSAYLIPMKRWIEIHLPPDALPEDDYNYDKYGDGGSDVN